MKFDYKPKSDLEKFGVSVYNALVENFSQTYFVGGTVRDILLGKKITDIDLATSATPQQVTSALREHFIEVNAGYQNFGVIMAVSMPHRVAIATFRKDLPAHSRYPEVTFVKTPKEDSKRRDFTINALYLSLKDKKVLDFYYGQKDLKNKKITFIGVPAKRIQEDPLRIIRALRFSLNNNFKIEKKSYTAIKKHFHLVKEISKGKLQTEFSKIEKEKNKKILEKVINNPLVLDKFFYKS
jgi:tRNA nucleotidyltransferase/poly(A) polymerase